MFSKNKNLVYYVLKKLGLYTPYSDNYEDLVQQGFLGLWKACKGFNPDLGFQFVTYAYMVIKGDILRYLRDFDTTIKLPRSYLDLRSKIRKHGFELPLTEEEVEVLVSEGVKRSNIESYEELVLLPLDSPVGYDNNTSLQEIIPDGKDYFNVSLDESPEDEVEGLLDIILQYYHPPKSVHRDLIEEYLYAILEDINLNQTDLAKKYHMSQAQVSRVIKSAQKIFREHQEEIQEYF